jgi:hypothetical protein
MHALSKLLLSSALAFGLTGCRKTEDIELTSWFTVRYTRPAVSWGYPMRELANSAVARSRLGSSWQPVSQIEESTYFRATPFAGGSRVLLFGGVGDWQIFREGVAAPIQIPREQCESFAYVAGDSDRVICPKCNPAEGRSWGCDQLRLHVLGGDGQVLLDRELDLRHASARIPREAEFVGLLPDDTVLFNVEYAGPENHPQSACRLIGVSASGEKEFAPLMVIDYCHRLADWPRPMRELPAHLPAWDSYDQFRERVSPGCG